MKTKMKTKSIKAWALSLLSAAAMLFAMLPASALPVYAADGGASIAVTGVEMSMTEGSIVEGNTFLLMAYVAPDDASNTDVTWSSSDETVATVNADGWVTGVKAGSAVITATTADGGFTADCTVTVTEPVKVTELTICSSNLSAFVGEKRQLSIAYEPLDATDTDVTWSSSNETVATVDEDGVATALAAGTTTITATTCDGSNLTASGSFTVFKDYPDVTKYTATKMTTAEYSFVDSLTLTDADLTQAEAEYIAEHNETILASFADADTDTVFVYYAAGDSSDHVRYYSIYKYTSDPDDSWRANSIPDSMSFIYTADSATAYYVLGSYTTQAFHTLDHGKCANIPTDEAYSYHYLITSVSDGKIMARPYYYEEDENLWYNYYNIEAEVTEAGWIPANAAAGDIYAVIETYDSENGKWNSTTVLCGQILTTAENTYEILNGANQSVAETAVTAVTSIRGSGELAKFTGVKVDGVLVPSSNYTLTEGSTIITFKPAYLKTLSVGKHTVEMYWTDGTASTILAVTAAKAGTDSAVTAAVSSPKTGETSNLFVFVLLGVALASGAVLTLKKREEK